MKIEAIHTRLFQEEESLELFISEHIPRLTQGAVLHVAF